MKRTCKKRGAHLTKTILLRIFSCALALLLLTVGFFAIKGYLMYQNAIKETPVEEIIVTVKNQEGFTKYEDLPSIYIDAVIAAEDRL